MNKKTQYSLKSSQKSKVLLFLILNFFFCQSLSSQFYWQKTYRSPIVNGDDEAFDGCFAESNNFYAVGSAASGPPYFFVLKINQLGDTVWTKTFSDGRLYSVTPDRNFGCVTTGLRGAPFSVNLSSNGNIGWDKTYNNAEAHDITRTNDSGFVLCAGIFSGYVCKLDTAGNIQWERTYNSVPLEVYSIELALDGGYILSGRKFISGGWRAYLIKIDGGGNILWEKTYLYNFPITAIAKLNYGYILVSNTFVGSVLRTVTSKTDLLGNLILSDTLINNSLWDSFPSIVRINSNKFIVSFHSDVPEPEIWGSRIISIDSNLNIINELLLKPDTNSLNIYKVIKAPGSNIDDLLCIGSAEPNSGGDLDVYIARIDSTLNQPPPNSVTVISNEIPGSFELYQNYPNPFNPETQIKFEIPKTSNIKIAVYDMLGREVFSINEYKKAGSYEVKFDGSNLASGMYFYTFETNGYKDTKKMVLLK